MDLDLRWLHTSPKHVLVGSSALYLLQKADAIYDGDENEISAYRLAKRTQKIFQNTLTVQELKGIDLCTDYSPQKILKVQSDLTDIIQSDEYLFGTHLKSRKTVEFFKSHSEIQECWKLTIDSDIYWTLPIHNIIFHNLLYHLYHPPKKPLKWIDTIEDQFTELTEWFLPEELISKLSIIARLYQAHEPWPILFEKRTDKNIAGEVLYYLIELRGAKFFENFLQ